MKQQFENLQKGFHMQANGNNSSGESDPKDPKPKQDKPTGVIKPIPLPEKNPKKQ